MLFNLRHFKVYAYHKPVDMRKGHNGLSGLVYTTLHKDLLSGAAFLFLSKNRKTAKIIVWDGTGLVVLHKKLVRKRFINIFKNNHALELTMSELNLLFEGSQFSLPLSCKEYLLAHETCNSQQQ